MVKKLLQFILDIIYCLKLSLSTSILYTVSRIIIQILRVLLPLAGVYILKKILDTLIYSNKLIAINIFSLLIFIYLLIQILFQLISKLDEYFRQIHEEIMENYITKNLIDKSSKIDISFFDSPLYYDRIQLLKSNIYSINQMFWNIISLISYLISFITSFIIILQYNIFYAFIIILSYLPLAICDQIYVKNLYKWQTKNIGEQRKIAYISNIITQKIFSKSIRFFGIADYLLDIYSGLWDAWFIKRKVIVKKWSIISLILLIPPQIITILLLAFVGINIINGINSIGDFSLYSGIIGQLVASVFIITSNLSKISENKIRIKDYREFNSWNNQIEGTGKVELESIDKIIFQNVSFTYPGNDRPTLKNLSFEINRCDRLAFVGINGTGKSTLIKLILRFYDVTEGEILINGENIKNFTPESIRKHFSVMFQDYNNFAFTLRENIRISDIKKYFTDDDIFKVCRKSGVAQVFRKWEKGLDSYIYKEFEKDGIELSSGENQKIALGRTFFKDSEIVILDEPSSSLDAESEYILFRKIASLCKDKGIILISHRLSNIIFADKIIVLEDGNIVEQGSHAELIKKGGRYATLYNYQSKQYN